jgi:small redox-active disulfide protein 2
VLSWNGGGSASPDFGVVTPAFHHLISRRCDLLKIQVFGPGCPKCEMLTNNAEAAATELGLDFELEKVSDIDQVLTLGVVIPPALVIDGKIVTMGKAPSVSEIKKLLT